jgi:hypothetical protein
MKCISCLKLTISLQPWYYCTIEIPDQSLLTMIITKRLSWILIVRAINRILYTFCNKVPMSICNIIETVSYILRVWIPKRFTWSLHKLAPPLLRLMAAMPAVLLNLASTLPSASVR